MFKQKEILVIKLFFIFLLMFSINAFSIELVKEGKSNAVIVVRKDAWPVERFAAKELQEHIELASGAKIPIISEEKDLPANMAILYIGKTKAAALEGIDPYKLPYNSFILRTRGNAIFFCGHDSDGPALAGLDYTIKTESGSLFAVYDFLEKQLNIRWLWPGKLGTVVPKRKTISIGTIDCTNTPQLKGAFLRVGKKRAKNTSWSSLAAKEKFLKEQDLWLRRHRFQQRKRYSPTHSFSKYWKRFEKSNPEFFQLLPNGKRGPLPGDPHGYNISMCVSSPGLHKQIVADWKKDGKHKWNGVISCGENDTPGMCTCSVCRNWDSKDERFAKHPYWGKGEIPQRDQRFRDHIHLRGDKAPSLSDRYARFYLAVQAEAKKYVKEPRVVGFAYANYIDAPRKTKLNKDIYIDFVPGYVWPWTPKKVSIARKSWDNWVATGASMMLRPNYMLAGHNMPIAYAREFAKEFSHMMSTGVKFTEFDSLVGSYGTQGPTLYTIAQMHVHPKRPVEDILNEYYSGFGPACNEIRAYFEYFERISQAMTDEQCEKLFRQEGSIYWFMIMDRIFTDSIMQKAGTFLEKAQKIVQNDSIYRKRVEFLKKGLCHAELTIAAVKAMKKYKKPQTEQTRLDYIEALRNLQDFRNQTESWNINNYFYLVSREKIFFDRTLLDTNQGDTQLATWKFMWDIKEIGEKQSWQQADSDDSAWYNIKTDAPWEKQAVGQTWQKKNGEPYNGAAWYRTSFLLSDRQAKNRVNILFGAIDESAVVYINGEKVLTRMYDKKNPNMWREPFDVDVTKAVHPGKNILAVKVIDRSGLGGIWKPVWLRVTSKMNTSANNLIANGSFEKGRKKWVFSAKNNADYKLSTSSSKVFCGKKSLEIQGKPKAGGKLSQKIPVTPGKFYTLKLRVCSSADFSGLLKVYAEGSCATVGNTSGVWKEVTIDKVTSQRDIIYLAVFMSKAGGTVWLDGIELYAN